MVGLLTWNIVARDTGGWEKNKRTIRESFWLHRRGAWHICMLDICYSGMLYQDLGGCMPICVPEDVWGMPDNKSFTFKCPPRCSLTRTWNVVSSPVRTNVRLQRGFWNIRTLKSVYVDQMDQSRHGCLASCKVSDIHIPPTSPDVTDGWPASPKLDNTSRKIIERLFLQHRKRNQRIGFQQNVGRCMIVKCGNF